MINRPLCECHRKLVRMLGDNRKLRLAGRCDWKDHHDSLILLKYLEAFWIFHNKISM